jgi:RNA polymerase sigma factor (sigma-70 family)
MLGQGDPTGNGTAALASKLFQQHSSMVLAICRRLLVDSGEAEDAMQQSFLCAYRSLLAGREPRQPGAWLASIARNECLNRIRARAREPVADRLANGAVGSSDALNEAIASEDLRALGHTIKKLPTQQREALLLHEFCGLRYEEVAAAIGVSESAIGSLLFRARTRLRFLLQRANGLLPVPWLWDFARAPAVKVAALPAVAKVGTAAVAVSLATGTAVVIERKVEAPKKPTAPPARVSPATASPTGVVKATAVAAAVAVQPPVRSSSPRVVPVTARTHIRKLPPARTFHKTDSVRPTAVVAPQDPTVDPAASAPAAPPGQATKASDAASAHTQSAHASTGNAKSNEQHGNGRSSEKAAPSGKADKQGSATQGSSTGNASDKSDKTANGNALGNDNTTPNGNAGGSHEAEAQPQENGSSSADHASAGAGTEGDGQSSHSKQ